MLTQRQFLTSKQSFISVGKKTCRHTPIKQRNTHTGNRTHVDTHSCLLRRSLLHVVYFEVKRCLHINIWNTKPATLHTAKNMLVNKYSHLSSIYKAFALFQCDRVWLTKELLSLQVYIQPLCESSQQASESHYVAVKTGSVTFWPIRSENCEEAVPYFCPGVLMKLYLLSV